jgi:hypothetical protein
MVTEDEGEPEAVPELLRGPKPRQTCIKALRFKDERSGPW